MTEAHAFLSPSSADVWGPGGCPASPRMAAAFPEDGEDLAAREGTAAHWYISETIQGRAVAEGDFAPNGEPITAEMIECAGDMLADMSDVSWRMPWAAERRVTMPGIHPTLNWGTADFIAFDPSARVVYAWDFKFGHGYVDAFENYQLVDYALGALDFYDLSMAEGRGWTFDLRIYQPRSFHADGPVKTWRPDTAAMLHHSRMLAEAARAATDPNAPMQTGDHCRYCPARHACPALQEAGGAAMDMAAHGAPNELTDENAALALRHVQTAIARLEALSTGLEAQVEAAVRAGKSVGWELEQGYGREKWTAPAEEVASVADLLGVEIRKPVELLTPAQARKKGFDDAVISAYAEKPLGKVKLKPLDGKSVRKAFS